MESAAHQSTGRPAELFPRPRHRRAGAFVVVAENFQSFGQAIVKKLIAEIAEAPRPAEAVAPGG
ncbi:MAG: DUF1194 domain-containing protein [Alphaproteobacteria bacterium]|nr:DUF1194 domain-containing protein [Alphaproteobacteria bacterium]